MANKPTHYRLVWIAVGSGPFPIDCLRYDSCIPASETDSNKIDHSHNHEELRAVCLYHFQQPGGPLYPTDGMWASFGGWQIIAVDPEMPASDDIVSVCSKHGMAGPLPVTAKDRPCCADAVWLNVRKP